MTEDQVIGRGEILALVTEIVSAHVANNAVTQSDVPELIQAVFSKISELASGEEAASVELTPAVPKASDTLWPVSFSNACASSVCTPRLDAISSSSSSPLTPSSQRSTARDEMPIRRGSP